MQAGQKHGMQTMNQALFDAVMKKQISKEDALRRTSDELELNKMLGDTVTTW